MKGDCSMHRLYAQGDTLLEQLDDAPISGRRIESSTQGPVTVAEGEATGHHHRVIGQVTMYRDDALACDVPSGLYIAHLKISGAGARLQHEEHAPIALEKGTYRVRRQRQLEPNDFGSHIGFEIVED
jgi:hypothetical protein